MEPVYHKPMSLRRSVAAGIVFCSPDTADLIRMGTAPCGHLFDRAEMAAFLGAKAVPQLLPLCHTVALDAMEVQFALLSLEEHAADFGEAVCRRSGIVIRGSAAGIGRAGVDMEVLAGVSLAALQLYHQLKEVDPALEIGAIHLLPKEGAYPDQKKYFATPPDCAVLVCSDAVASGRKEDRSGPLVCEMLRASGARIKHCAQVPDDPEAIRSHLRRWVAEDVPFVFTTGGTGLGPRDSTVDTVQSLIERDADGIVEAMRGYGQMRGPLAMMSRAAAGSIGRTLVVTLPGSVTGARESLEAILPAVFHARKMLVKSDN
ncbi:MAG TPA: bifunctional molybdenum cofactor biosynthesis protein MoaC/MoaB [Chitinophagaceae bacterium]|jgi:molybdenum cofactor biosynthesis protein MoaC|nr:bifunctional molybdenum cofactor biosynthesis protein MoaC/MoaB [Chitinophagaceae bacterium]